MATRTQKDSGRAAFPGGYSARDVARLMDVSLDTIRDYVAAGFLTPRRGSRGEHRFSFQDLIVMRTARDLLQHLPARKVKRALSLLRDQLPRGRKLTSVRITAEGDSVVVRDGSIAWNPESGQALLDFSVSNLAAEVAPLARKTAEEARSAERHLSAEDWYELGCDLEAVEIDQARDAYRRALELEPDHVDARLNLGRLLHETGAVPSALTHYRLALSLRPTDAIAAFNLGVALEDLGKTEEAVRAYEQAIRLDGDCADAHFNLGRLAQRLGRPRAALRHLATYRRLMEEQG